MKHLFVGWHEQMSAVLTGRPAARAELIIRIKAETVGLALFHSLGSIAHSIPPADFTMVFLGGLNICISKSSFSFFDDIFYTNGGLQCSKSKFRNPEVVHCKREAGV